MSRALSVHQGKGKTHEDAKLGALLEAVESDAAERFAAEGPIAAWDALDSAHRPEFFSDFAADRTSPPSCSQPLRWVEATRVDGGVLMVPFDCVSLDFTREKQSRFERSSAGLATGQSRDDARRVALLELVERDAVSRFMQLGFVERLQCEIQTGTDRFSWFEHLQEKMGRLDLRLFAPPSPTGIPVVIAAIGENLKRARPYAATIGHAAHGDPELALFNAVAEALQSRLTLIAGSREDCWPSLYTRRDGGIAASLAPPPAVGIDGVPFTTMKPMPDDPDNLAKALAGIGVEQTAFVQIAQPEGFVIVRAFAPGLGSLAKEARL